MTEKNHEKELQDAPQNEVNQVDDTISSEQSAEESVEIEKEVTPDIAQATNGKLFDDRVYAGFWIRFCAYIVDILVIGAITNLILRPVFNTFDWPISEALFSPYNILSAVIFYLYFVLLTKRFGQSLGKMIFGLKIISLKNQELTWATVIFRELIGRYISATIVLLYLIVAFMPKKQGLHDYFAETTVIHEYVVLKQQTVEN